MLSSLIFRGFVLLTALSLFAQNEEDYSYYESPTELILDREIDDLPSFGTALVDFDQFEQGIVLEIKKIEIPGYPFAYNPSIASWRGSLLMIFRFFDPLVKTAHRIGIISLDKDFCPIGDPQIIRMDFIDTGCIRKRQDPRLIVLSDHLYLAYNNVLETDPKQELRRMCIAEVQHDGREFYVDSSEVLLYYEGLVGARSEKNWVPFDYKGNLLFAYSLLPHKILYPLFGKNSCETVSSTSSTIRWDWGVLRGGTPAILVDGEYLGFFHSTREMPSLHSDGKIVPHYFMGAYTFSPEPPFTITRISPEPIFNKNFYQGKNYRTWKPLHVVFPGGLIASEGALWVAYGRQDHEIWVAKIDQKKLLETLTPVCHD